MNMTNFVDGIARVLNCPKVHVATAGLVSTYFALRYAVGDLPPNDRAALWVAFVAAVTVQLREIINAWSREDVAGMRPAAASIAAPSAGVSAVSIAPPYAPASAASMAATSMPANAPPRSFAPVTSPGAPAASSLSPSRNAAKTSPASASAAPANLPRTAMPPRTRLTLLLLAPALLMAGGCATNPELQTYREGLHAVDEPLYQAHLLLMDDAVNAHIRGDADRQVVQMGIAQARALYQQSATGSAAPISTPGLSSTQPSPASSSPAFLAPATSPAQ